MINQLFLLDNYVDWCNHEHHCFEYEFSLFNECKQILLIIVTIIEFAPMKPHSWNYMQWWSSFQSRLAIDMAAVMPLEQQWMMHSKRASAQQEWKQYWMQLLLSLSSAGNEYSVAAPTVVATMSMWSADDSSIVGCRVIQCCSSIGSHCSRGAKTLIAISTARAAHTAVIIGRLWQWPCQIRPAIE